MAYTVNNVIKNRNKTNLDYLSGFINSWELLQHIVSRFMITRDRLRPFVITPFFERNGKIIAF